MTGGSDPNTDSDSDSRSMPNSSARGTASEDDGAFDLDRDRDHDSGTAVDYDGFDALPEPGVTGSQTGTTGVGDDATNAESTAEHRSGSDARAGGATASRDADAGRRGPLGDLAAAVDERSAADRAGTDDAFDDLFEREDVAELDPDRLWERLENDEPLDDRFADDREIREIDKHEYCHRCEHFAEPPGVGCTREDTAILELVTLDTFRVADCPVVLENEELERRY